MAYTVRNSNNVVIATVADNSIDSSTDITLIGKNFTGYGVRLNENLIYMLENFAKNTAPTKAIRGQLWYDTATNDLKVYNGSSFVFTTTKASNLDVTGNVIAANLIANSAVTAGNINVTGNVSAAFFTGNGSQLTGVAASVLVNGTSNVTVINNSNVTVGVAGTSNSLVISSTGIVVAGTATIDGNANIGNLNTNIITANTFRNGNSNVAITANSNVSVFVNGNTTARAVFTNSGANIAGNLGITSNLAVTGNVSAAFFIGDGSQITNLTIAAGSSIVNGNSNVRVAANSNVTVAVTGSDRVTFATTGMTIVGNVLPSANVTYNLGATGARWSNIWGVSSSALYADLAEKYESDAYYDAGTVVRIGGTKEITVCNDDCSNEVFGCISQNPAYLMNDGKSDPNWLPVVLHGRSMIKVTGQVRKGDRLVAAGNGYARKGNWHELTYQTEIGRALSDKTDSNIGLIEAFISTK